MICHKGLISANACPLPSDLCEPATGSTAPETLESSTDPELSLIWCSRAKAGVLLLKDLHEDHTSLHRECIIITGNTFLVYLERKVIAVQRPHMF